MRRRLLPLTDAFKVPVTSALCSLAITVSVASFGKRDTSILGMNRLAFEGEPWRVLTSAFPHVNVLHLVFNLFWIWFFGAIIEQRYGSMKTLALVVVLEVGSTLAQYALVGPGVGLSGIGYGFFGLLWVLHRRDPALRDALDSRTSAIFVGWFFLGIAAKALGVMSIGNVAHGMGALLGVLVGTAIGSHGLRRVGSALLVPLLLGASLMGASTWRVLVNLEPTDGQDPVPFCAVSAVFYQRALRTYPLKAEWWFKLGAAYEGLGNLDDATVAYRRAIELDSGSEPYRKALAHIAWHEDYKALVVEDEKADEAAARAVDAGAGRQLPSRVPEGLGSAGFGGVRATETSVDGKR